jgi:hypothetical protein
MERALGHDFAAVRIHEGPSAAHSAASIHAIAYTSGRDVVFGAGAFQPTSERGRRLIAHELTHVVQQGGRIASEAEPELDDPSSPAEREAKEVSNEATRSNRAGPIDTRFDSWASGRTLVARADPAAVGYVRLLGTTPRTGIQFVPTNVTDTRVGPVTVQGGLISTGSSRLDVIIGANLTPRMLAQVLLPLWTTATPFTPTGGVPQPLAVISELELAQALMVYNQFYLGLPDMSRWRAGLRFPLPAEIEELTGIATLNPQQIQALAAAFDPAFAPLLDTRASATGAAPPTLAADVAAFLVREPTALARGIHLAARALTNTVAELPFVRTAFQQLGPDGFDVALAFMDNLVNRDITLLAVQRDGAAILAVVRTALGSAPATPSAAQTASLQRANLMLGLVAATVALVPPAAARAQPRKTVTVDTVKLDGSTHTPSADVALASSILEQCDVGIRHGVNATATNAQTTTWLGGNTDLATSPSCGAATAEERALFNGATATFGLTAPIRAFYPATFSGSGAGGYSVPAFCATGPAAPLRGMVVLRNVTTREDLAHEIGHTLLNSGAHPAANLMSPFSGRAVVPLTDAQCTTIYANA